LILGSLPGTVSLARREYYAQPQNSFWPILGSLLGFDLALPYAQRAEQLCLHRVALWDVCRCGIRPGSLDSSIRRDSVVPNNFADFLRKHRALRAIAFNGRAAESLFRSRVAPALASSAASLHWISLPSTSPAYASLRFAGKLARWRVVLDWLA
jgi:hypoxanthine-DNA glycosylase